MGGRAKFGRASGTGERDRLRRVTTPRRFGPQETRDGQLRRARKLAEGKDEKRGQWRGKLKMQDLKDKKKASGPKTGGRGED